MYSIHGAHLTTLKAYFSRLERHARQRIRRAFSSPFKRGSHRPGPCIERREERVDIHYRLQMSTRKCDTLGSEGRTLAIHEVDPQIDEISREGSELRWRSSGE